MRNSPPSRTLPEAPDLLCEDASLVGASGGRTDSATLETATRICSGEQLSNFLFVNKIFAWLGGLKLLKKAAMLGDGLEFLIDILGALEAGVHIWRPSLPLASKVCTEIASAFMLSTISQRICPLDLRLAGDPAQP